MPAIQNYTLKIMYLSIPLSNEERKGKRGRKKNGFMVESKVELTVGEDVGPPLELP